MCVCQQGRRIPTGAVDSVAAAIALTPANLSPDEDEDDVVEIEIETKTSKSPRKQSAASSRKRPSGKNNILDF